MADAEETPEELREEVEQEIEDLIDTAAAEERARLAEREAEGLDEPS